MISSFLKLVSEVVSEVVSELVVLVPLLLSVVVVLESAVPSVAVMPELL